MVWFQDSILKCLRHYTLFSMLFHRISKAHYAQILSCSSLGVGTMFIIQTSPPNLSIIFPNFFHSTSNMTWITPSFNCKYPSMHVDTSHQPYGHSYFTLCSWQRAHMNSWCNSWHLYYHCVRHWFPHGTKKLHTLPSTTFNSTCWWVNIVFTKDDIHTLTNIIIVDPMWACLFPWSCTTQ